MSRSPVKSSRRAALRSARRTIASGRDAVADGAALAEHGHALVTGLGLRAGAVVTSYDAVPGEPHDGGRVVVAEAVEQPLTLAPEPTPRLVRTPRAGL